MTKVCVLFKVCGRLQVIIHVIYFSKTVIEATILCVQIIEYQCFPLISRLSIVYDTFYIVFLQVYMHGAWTLFLWKENIFNSHGCFVYLLSISPLPPEM